MTLTQQLHEIQEMIATTKKLLKENPDDAMLLYMLTQDEALYSSTIASAYKAILPLFENAEEVLLDFYPKSHTGAVDPFAIAQHFNIEVKKDPILSDGIGRCEFFEDKICITYKPTNRFRDRFTIAHELGHIFLHFSQGLSLTFVDHESVDDELHIANNPDYEAPLLSAARLSDGASDAQVEFEANNFAGELLVPRFVLDKILNRLPKGKAINASLLQDLFKVSRQVIVISLRSYGLLNSGQILDDINIHKRGW